MESTMIRGSAANAPLYHTQENGNDVEEKPLLERMKDFFVSNIVDKDEKSGDFRVSKKMYGVAAAETALGAGIGYKVGASHEANDVVTRDRFVRDVMKDVQTGERAVTGGYHHHYGYHFDAMKSEWKFGWHYGYDPGWVHNEPVYTRVPTGEKVVENVTRHRSSYPYTALQGLLLGTLIGGAIGVATLLISKIIAGAKNN